MDKHTSQTKWEENYMNNKQTLHALQDKMSAELDTFRDCQHVPIKGDIAR